MINQLTELEQHYVKATSAIMCAVVTENPAYKELVGNTIYPYVFQLVNVQTPTITGMILEFCAVEDLRAILNDHRHLVVRVAQALELKAKRERAAAEATEAKEHEADVQEIDDNISEATQASDIGQKEADVNVTTTAQKSADNSTQQSDENEHENAFFTWTESMNRKQA